MASGLSDNDVNCMAIDSSGYLWAGTSYGLNKYDGYHITTYYSHTNPALKSNEVYSIVCDHKNRLWVLTLSSITLINEQRQFDTIPDLPGLGHVRTIVFSPTVGIILAGNTFYVLPIGKDPLNAAHWQAMPWASNWNHKNQLREISHYNNDWFVVTTKKSASLVNFKTQQITCTIPIDSSRQSCMVNDTLIACINFSKGAILLFQVPTGKLLKTYYCQSSEMGNTILNNLYAIRKAANGELLVTSANGGLFRLDIATSTLVNEVHRASDPSSIASNYTGQLLCLSNGTIIVGTRTNGLDITNLNQAANRSQQVFSNSKGNVYDGFINGIVKDTNDWLWMGSQTGLIQWNPMTNMSNFYNFPNQKSEQGFNKQLTIKAVAIDSAQRIWVSAYGGGIAYFSVAQHRLVLLSIDSSRSPLFKSKFIHQFLVRSNGSLWVCSGTGIYSIQLHTLQAIDNTHHPVLKKLEGLRVLSLAEDRFNRIWIGTSANGIYCYDEARQTLQQYTMANGLPSNNCVALCSDAANNMYAATPNGLSVIHNNGTIKVYNTSNGLRSNKCQAVIRDMDGNIWVANQQYLVKYSPTNNSFVYSDNTAGLTNESYRNGAAFAANDGTLYWGTVNGVNYFQPAKLGMDATPLQVNIATLQTSDNNFTTVATRQFWLSANDADITLHFAATDLLGSKNILYQYQLNGLNSNNKWDTATDIRQITYSALAAGKYQFNLKASKDGLHWQQAAPVYFTIPSPWYKAWWFMLICITASVLLVYTWVKNREVQYRQAQQQNAKEIRYQLTIEQAQNVVQQRELELALLHKNLADAQLTAIRAQMNPHFIFNALNSVQQYILLGNVDQANKYLAKFSRLQREILNHCDQQFITLQKEIDMLQLFVEFEQLRLNDGFHYHLQMDSKIDADELLVPPMILQPFVENAIWHGLQPKENKRALSIDFALSANEEYLLCTIVDNGIGRTAAKNQKHRVQKQSHTSKGLMLVGERLELLEQQYGGKFSATITDLYTSTQIPAGTKVELVFFMR